MESSNIDKSPLNFDESNKFSHCLEIYSLLKMQKNKVRFYPDDIQMQTFAQLFNTYYTHCEYKSGSQK